MAEVFIELGDELEALDDHVGAAEHYRRAAALDPSDVEAWTSLGNSLLAAGQGGGALSHQAMRGAVVDALAAFDCALKVEPDDTDLLGYRRHALWLIRQATTGLEATGGPSADVSPTATIAEAKELLRCVDVTEASGADGGDAGHFGDTPPKRLVPQRVIGAVALGAASGLHRDRPVLIEGLAPGWDFGGLSLEGLRERQPELQLALRQTDAAGGKVSVRCAAFIDHVLCEGLAAGAILDAEPLVVFDYFALHAEAGEELRACYATPQVAALDFGARILDRLPTDLVPPLYYLLVGPAGSGTPVHQDPPNTASWNVLCEGRKRWAMLSPAAPAALARRGEEAGVRAWFDVAWPSVCAAATAAGWAWYDFECGKATLTPHTAHHHHHPPPHLHHSPPAHPPLLHTPHSTFTSPPSHISAPGRPPPSWSTSRPAGGMPSSTSKRASPSRTPPLIGSGSSRHSEAARERAVGTARPRWKQL
jgi:tetratricopeptide (TPR) repeat protein